MRYKKSIIILDVVLIFVLAIIAWNGYNMEFVNGNCMEIHQSMVRCLGIILYEEYQSVAFILTSLLFSTIPFYFTPKKAYKIWKMFAVIAIPIIAFLIYKSPEQINAPLNIGSDRETTSMILSVVFVVVSWLIAVFGALRGK